MMVFFFYFYNKFILFEINLYYYSIRSYILDY